MPKIEAAGITTFETKPGRRLVLELEDHGVDILHRCGGLSKCTTCRVVVLEGNPGVMTERERERLEREDQLAPDTRLSCQILCDTDLKVQVLRRFSESGLSDPGPRPHEDIDSEVHA
ncbi:MAG TPA: 2Fe-2S iron-sulfur cluster-binding protein [Thermomicrobiales bacterium]|nr:2Fe-2S iron-sulfur cluster-binding protein [Thermomicrobiales bacterium]